MRTDEHSSAFHAEVNIRVEWKRQARLWISVTQCQTTPDHLSSFRAPLQSALPPSLGKLRVFILFFHLPVINLRNTDTRITQAFNRLFVRVKVDRRPLGKESEGGNREESWGMQGYRGGGVQGGYRGGGGVQGGYRGGTGGGRDTGCSK